MSSDATFSAGQTTNTPTTPNSNATCAATGDDNDTTNLAFLYNNITPYWSPSVSSAFTTVTLSADRGNAVVTWKEGLTVTYIPQSGGNYTVTLDGTIVDGGTIYKKTGQSLGTFKSIKTPE